MLWLSLLVPAQAGELAVFKKFPFAVHTWVDGQSVGKVKNKKNPTVLELPAGPHEVWFAGEDTGTITLCHGMIDVPETGRAETWLGMGATQFKCNNQQPGFPNGPSAFKGSFVDFQVDSGVDAWVSIDGGQIFAFPSMPFELNLTPGTHTLVLYRDVHKSSVFDQGTVTLQAGQRLPVTCTTAGCLGFDAPPVVLVEYTQAPQIQLFSLQVSTEVNVTDGNSSSSTSVSIGIEGH